MWHCPEEFDGSEVGESPRQTTDESPLFQKESHLPGIPERNYVISQKKGKELDWEVK